MQRWADEIKEIFKEQYGFIYKFNKETVTEKEEGKGWRITGTGCDQWVLQPPDLLWSVEWRTYCQWSVSTGKSYDCGRCIESFCTDGERMSLRNGVEYVVEDTGAFARYGVQFDVYYGDYASASVHGHQTWEAYIADSNGSQEVEVTTTREVNRLDVTLTNHNLDTVLRNRMTDKEQEKV